MLPAHCQAVRRCQLAAGGSGLDTADPELRILCRELTIYSFDFKKKLAQDRFERPANAIITGAGKGREMFLKLSAGLVALIGAMVGALQGQEALVLRPESVFQLDAPDFDVMNTDIATQAIVAKAGRLAFLRTAMRSLAPQKIVITDRDGKVTSSFEIKDVRVASTWLGMDKGGRIWVTFSRKDPIRQATETVWRAYTIDGATQAEVKTPDSAIASCPLSDKILYLEPGLTVRSLSMDNSEANDFGTVSGVFHSPVRPSGVHMVTAGEGIWIVDGVALLGRYLPANSSNKPSDAKFRSPELDQSTVPRVSPNSITLGMSSVAAGGSLLYAKVGKFRMADGLPVLVFADGGDLRRRFRLQLPSKRAWSTPGNSDGYLSTYAIQVDGSDLFVSGANGVVARYRIPD